MVTRITTYDYEQSSESGRERHVLIPYSRQTDTTPTLHDPAQVTGAVVGSCLTGTVVTIDDTDDVAVLNVAKGAVYRHNVRNVITYSGGNAEATYRAINIGDPVYYDSAGTMPAYTKLSTSPLDINVNGTTLNTLFGWVVMMQEETSASFPKGTTTASTHVCAVMQK
jgi:hypothetical protein